MYGPKGWTNNPQILDIIGIKNYPSNRNYVQFNDLTGYGLRELAKLVSPEQMEDRQNSAPTFETFIDMSFKDDTLEFFGYLITDGRDDERITIEGCVSSQDNSPAFEWLRNEFPQCWPPDEWNGNRAWWD